MRWKRKHNKQVFRETRLCFVFVLVAARRASNTSGTNSETLKNRIEINVPPRAYRISRTHFLGSFLRVEQNLVVLIARPDRPDRGGTARPAMASKRRQAKKEEGDDDEDDKKIREAARSMFASLFLGGWDDDPSATNGATAVPPAAVGPSPLAPARPGTDRATLPGENSSSLGKSTASDSSSSSSSSSTGASLGGLGRQVAEHVRTLIPEDREKLRQTALYKEAYKGIQWQRDNYLVGREYANWRVKERHRRLDPNHHNTRSVQSFVHEIPYDEGALAHPQFAGLAASFLPSYAVKGALVPLIVPVVENQLYPVARQGVVQLIESQQDNLHHVLKGQIVQFLDNPQNRTDIKNSTRGYISTSAAYGEGKQG
jgi:hypothetical protein